MKRLLSLLALLLSAPVFAASDVTPVYPDLILQKNVTTVSTGSPQRTQPVAYQIVATGTGATVSATVKIYCKTINLPWASGTQQGSDITLSASNTDVDSSVTVTGACPYLYSDVTAISSTTVEVVATPFNGGGSGSSSTSPAYVTIVDSSGDSAVDATANAAKVKIVTPDGTDASSDADGLLVNLGANNDVTVTSGTVSFTSSIGSPVYVASGGNTCRLFTADGAIGAAGSRILYSIFVANATANDDLIIYDNTSAAGTKIFQASNVAAGVTSFPILGASATNGLYLDLTTGGSLEVVACYQ